MKGNRSAIRFIGLFLCIFLLSPMICKAAPEGYTEVKARGITMCFPDDWHVMYEGKENLEEVYTKFQLDTYESFQKYMDGTIIEAVSTDDVNLSSELGSFENEKAIDIYMMDDTSKFQPGYEDLKGQSEDVKQEFLESYGSKMKSESGMSAGDTYLLEGTNADFAVINLSYSKYHYLVAGTVSNGKVFTFMALSHISEEKMKEKEAVLHEVLQSFTIEDIAAFDAGAESGSEPEAAAIEETDSQEAAGDIAEQEQVEQAAAEENVTSIVVPEITPPKKSFKMPLGIFVVLLPFVLIWGVKENKRREFHEDVFSLQITKGIQGFCAVGIMLHHMAQTITDNGKLDRGIINYMCDIGVFFVGIFFFCSGYGLYTSLKSKPDYLKGFFRKRLPTILVPFYVGNTIFVLTAMLFGTRFKTSELISVLTGWVLLNTQLWYIVEIFILYIVFYLLFRLSRGRLAYILMGVFVLGFMGFSLYLGHDFKTVSGGAWLKGEWWYNGVFLFFIGITFARYYDALMRNIKKYYPIWLLASLVGSGVFYSLTMNMLKTKGYWMEWDGYPGYLEKIQTLACQLPMIIFMVTAFFLITLKLQFRNKVLDFLGKISLELYIIHNLFIINLKNNIRIKDDFLFILSVYVMSISLAVLLYAFDQKIISFFTGRKSSGGESSLNVKSGEGKREHLIDSIRLIMAFLVVFIHAPFGGKVGELVFCFGKAAVPFFIVVSGYFCYSHRPDQFAARLKKQASRLFMLCAGANFLYVYLYLIGNKLGWSRGSLSSLLTEKSIVGLFLYNQSPVADHLWFLGSLFYALVLMLIFVTLKIDRFIIFTAPILLGIYFILSNYGGGDGIMYRNVLIVTLPYFMMGCLIRKYKEEILALVKPVAFNVVAVLFAALVVAEYLIRRNIGVPYLSIEVLVYLIVIVCLRYSQVGKGTAFEWLGSKCTLFVYIAHMGVLWVFWYFYTGFSGRYPALVTVLAYVIPLAVSVVIEVVKVRKKRVSLQPELN